MNPENLEDHKALIGVIFKTLCVTCLCHILILTQPLTQDVTGSRHLLCKQFDENIQGKLKYIQINEIILNY